MTVDGPFFIRRNRSMPGKESGRPSAPGRRTQGRRDAFSSPRHLRTYGQEVLVVLLRDICAVIGTSGVQIALRAMYVHGQDMLREKRVDRDKSSSSR